MERTKDVFLNADLRKAEVIREILENPMYHPNNPVVKPLIEKLTDWPIDDLKMLLSIIGLKAEAIVRSPEKAVIGNGMLCHFDLAAQLESQGYSVDVDSDDNEHSYVRHPDTGDTILAEILGEYDATVTNRED